MLEMKLIILQLNRKYREELNKFEENHDDDESRVTFYEKGKYIGKMMACMDLLNILKEKQEDERICNIQRG